MQVRFIAALVVCAAHGASAQQASPAADSAAIRRAALDYIEGWYTADSARMRRAIHPELAKRIPVTDRATARTRLVGTPADALVAQAGRGGGSAIPAAQREADVRILAIDEGMAMVRLRSTQLVDYMHLARVDGEWKIVNVLWDYRPEHRPGGSPSAPSGPAPVPAVVTAAQFASFRWLIGSFRGSAASGSPFYERYRSLNDSTIEVRFYKDSTFTTESSSPETIEYRGGRVRYGPAVATKVDGESIRFAAATGAPQGFVWTRGADGDWRATIEQTTPAGEVRRVVYDMRRVR